MKTIVKIQKGTDGYTFVTIPKKIADAKGWKHGDILAYMVVNGEIMPQGGDIIIRKVDTKKRLKKKKPKQSLQKIKYKKKSMN